MTKANTETGEITGLALLRLPFPAHQISKLPKPTKAQTEEVKADYKKGIRCDVCGAWHHPKVVHLDYVGHAALTDRLLDADPAWTWEPVAMGEDGQPKLDSNGGMWIRLTVCGVTRLGYGDAGDKSGANAVKERIGDALRNAAMRFGAALDLWHKGDLHADEETPIETDVAKQITNSTISPTAGLREQLKPVRLKHVEAVASEVIDCMEAQQVDTAYDVIEDAKLDTDEKAALWTFLGSGIRSALKKEHKKRAEAVLRREEATQA